MTDISFMNPEAAQATPEAPEAESEFQQDQDGVAAALLALGRYLAEADYRFVTPTPETHGRVIARRRHGDASDLRDVFGWNLPIEGRMLDAGLHTLLQAAHAIEPPGAGGQARARIRFATLDGLPYLHSGYPTQESDAVFFGPDTYRFVDAIEGELANADRPLARVLDVGCGGGAGGLMAARLAGRTGRAPPRIELVDINARALAYARVNAALFGIEAELREADLFSGTRPGLDLIVANPPYLLDAQARLYRHGGGRWGGELAQRIVREGLPLLSATGTLLLYTGTPVVGGRDVFLDAVEPLIDAGRFEHAYRELDPDVFGEELERPAYHAVERIAAVCLVVRSRGAPRPAKASG